MTLEELYYISQIVAVFAILASLAAVYWQVRQTNKIARADLMHRALTGAGPLSDAERARVEVAMAVVFGLHEGAFNLRQRDLMEIGAYNGIEALVRLYLRSPHAQGYWKRHRNEGKDPKFVALLDEILGAAEARQAAKTTNEGPQP